MDTKTNVIFSPGQRRPRYCFKQFYPVRWKQKPPYAVKRESYVMETELFCFEVGDDKGRKDVHNIIKRLKDTKFLSFFS